MMEFVWTFLEGLASFISPCTLPLMPVFAAYFAANREKGGFAKSLAFVFGFTVVFMALGVFAASVGAFFASHYVAVSVVSGLVVIVFGLGFLNVIRLPGFHGLRALPTPASSPSSCTFTSSVFPAFIFGLLYALNLTPCVGAFLAAALAEAAASGTALKGAALLGTYSLGLGIPFVLAGVALSRLSGLFNKIKSSYNVLVPVCGAMLILFGAWMVAKPFVGPIFSHLGAADEPDAVETADSAEAGESKEISNKESKAMQITSKDMFTAEVLKSDKPVIVDFWATWCGPCRMMAPVLEEVAASRADLKVCKVDVDNAPDLAAQYGISSIPCIILFRNGAEAARSIGFVRKEELLGALGL